MTTFQARRVARRRRQGTCLGFKVKGPDGLEIATSSGSPSMTAGS